MTDRVIHFDAITIHRVPGFRHGEGFTLSDLSPGINVIHGPNGSGKSTTARVIQELLWPGRTGLERPTVAGQFRDGEQVWRVQLDAGHVETTCDGRSGTLPELGPPENRHRYQLALHELIGADNVEFAKAIADASQGGYDLESSAAALGFTPRPPAPRGQANALQQCRQAVAAALHIQRGIDHDAGELRELRERRDQAAAAQRMLDLLEKARDYHEARRRCERIEFELSEIPSGVAQLRGDERAALDDLQQQRAALEAERVEERDRLDRAERELDALKLPEDGVGEQSVAALKAWQRRLAEVETEVRRQRRRITECDAEAGRARDRLGDRFHDRQLAALDRVAMDPLSVFARRADQVRARQAVLDEHRRRLERDEPDEVRGLSVQRIREGLTALGLWIASPAPDAAPRARVRAPIIVATGLLVLLAVALTVTHHWAWLVLIALAATLAAWDWWIHRRSAAGGEGDPRRVHQQSYQAAGLPAPAAWDVPTVSEHLRRLAHLVAVRESEDDRLRRLTDLRSEADACAQQRNELLQQRTHLQEQLGLTIELADEWLPLLVENIGQWQRRSGEASAARQVLAELTREERTLLDRIAAQLQPFGYDRVDSAESTAQAIDSLTERQARHRRARDERAGAERRIRQSIDPGLRDVAARKHAIYQRLGIDDSQDAMIDPWLAELANYRELTIAWQAAETIRRDRRQALAEHEILLELDAIDLARRMQEERELADRRDELTERIARIEQEIELAKSGHALSQALAAREDAAVALAIARQDCGRAAVGALLTNWVRTVAVEQARPQVFRRANELLVRFTRGTLQLDLDDHAGSPAFRARCGADSTRGVDRLSIGERVQLLAAVRVAFLEQDESARLPLLLDETLGTSDDGRAGAIIDSVIEIARQGRQVFYFTAQHDEVGKWVARLAEAGIVHKVIDLAQVRALDSAAASPLRIDPLDMPVPPAPSGMSREEYGRALHVPGVNPADEQLDTLHLWHLLDDLNLLHRLLCHQITSWGQLRTLLEHGGAGLVAVDHDAFPRIAAAAQAVKAACDAWRIGRGEPVDREALLQSELVTKTFIDELTTLARDKNGDAQRILDALDANEVKRWRTANTQQLREYFEEQGFLSKDSTLTSDEIRLRVLAAAADDIRQGLVTSAWIDRLLSQLPGESTL